MELVNRKLTGNNLHLYLNPERDSHEDALKVHGISNEFLQRQAQVCRCVPTTSWHYLQGAEHRSSTTPAFDVGFLNKELELAGLPPLGHLCGQHHRHPGHGQGDVSGQAQLARCACATAWSVDNSGRTLHGALLDAELLADVYINLTRGQDALLIVDEAHGRRGRRQGRRHRPEPLRAARLHRQ